MPRRSLVGCTLAVSCAIALAGATAGGSGSYAQAERSASGPPAATALRHQLARERNVHRHQLREAYRTVRVVTHQYGTDKLVQSAITLAAMTYNVDRGWMSAIIHRESRYRPWAMNPSGACGLGQFMPGTWARTPQGRAGLSCKDPLANAMAMAWLASQPGGRHNWDL